MLFNGTRYPTGAVLGILKAASRRLQASGISQSGNNIQSVDDSSVSRKASKVLIPTIKECRDLRGKDAKK